MQILSTPFLSNLLSLLEEFFRASVFKMLKKEGKINDDLINKLMNWRHSGFSVHNGVKVKRDEEEGREVLAQHIIRNTFSVEKLTYNVSKRSMRSTRFYALDAV